MIDTVHATGDAPQRQPLPPDSSLVQAWLTIALHPTRLVFAAVARIATRQWIIASLIFTGVLSLIANWLSVLQMSLRPVKAPANANSLFGILVPVIPPVVVASVAPLTAVIVVLANAYAVALFMPADRGTIRTRFSYVLGTFALAETVTNAASLLQQILVTGLVVAVRPPVGTLTCVSSLIDLGLLIYGVTLVVNSLSASSGRSRWAVFGISVLTTIILTIIVWYVPAIIVQTVSTHH